MSSLSSKQRYKYLLHIIFSWARIAPFSQRISLFPESFPYSPNSVLILIPCAPTFLLSQSHSSSYISQFKRKWSTVSFPPSHSHSEISMILNWCRYSFRWQYPVRNHMSHITCFHCYRTPYNLDSRAVSGCWFSFRSHFAISLSILHSISHLIFIMAWMNLFWADLILLMRTVEFEIAAVLLPDQLIHYPQCLHVLTSIQYGCCWSAWFSGLARLYLGFS